MGIDFMEQIRILQIGTEDWNEKYSLPENLTVIFLDGEITPKKELYEIVVLERNLNQKEAKIVNNMSMAYHFFVTDDFKMDRITSKLFDSKIGAVLKREDIQSFIDNDAKKYFPEDYGEKYNPQLLGIAQGFKGTVKWNGQYSVAVEGDYGTDFNQIVFWKNNLPIKSGQGIDLWLEYKKDPGVEIILTIKEMQAGSLSTIIDSWEFTEEDLKDIVTIEGGEKRGSFFASVKARGKGKLEIIGLHDRYSRWGIGTFIVGGERYVTSEREEIFAYFEPGNFKPPLAVHFSGYKMREGFEGYYMLRKMGCPFLLIADQRFEGGGFYIGSDEYEKLMLTIINKYMDKLRFYPDQVVLSGISMGTIGSMYYGCDLRPHALILGKPLVSLGDIAENERLKRPKGFATSLDLLRYYGGGMGQENIQRLNDRIWNKIRNADFSNTKLIVSYMIEDDYDSTAYSKLLSELNSSGVQVYGKGLHGRHNDNSIGINTWFKGQYDRVLKEDFER